MPNIQDKVVIITVPLVELEKLQQKNLLQKKQI